MNAEPYKCFFSPARMFLAVLGLCLGMASFSYAATAWQDEFTRNENPATGWGTYQSTLVAVNTGGGYGYLTLTGANTWGNADSADITLDTDVYNQLTISVAGLQYGLNYKVSILHDGSVTTDIVGYSDIPGTYTFNYVNAVRAVNAGWTGSRTFKVRVFLEKYATGTTATIDYIRITGSGTPTYTPTVTTTPTNGPTPVTGWDDEFTRDENPATGWGTFQSTLVAVNTGAGYGYLTITGANVWGNADSADIMLDTDVYNQLSINVTGLQDGMNWKVSILHDVSATTDVVGYSGVGGTHTFNFVNAVRAVNSSWTGTQTFKVRIFVEKYASGTTLSMDYVRIFSNATPTYTPTNSHTSTPSPVLTATPSPTASPEYSSTATPTASATAATGWNDEFTRNENPATGWSTFQTTLVAVNTGAGYGYLTITGANVWGNADSADITLDTNFYNQLAINVTGLQHGVNWKVSILHNGSTTTDVVGYTDVPGMYTFNFVNPVRAVNSSWTGTQTFKVRVFVEKYGTGTTATMDYIRISGSGAVPTITATPTITQVPISGWTDLFARSENPDTHWTTFKTTLVSSSAGDGYGYLTINGTEVWGNMDSESITLDTNVFNQFAIKVTNVQDGVRWKAAILHGVTTTDLSAFNTAAGTGNYNFVTTVRAVDAAWTGNQTFKVQVFLEKGGTGTTATIDYIQISTNATPTYTPTPSAGWIEPFDVSTGWTLKGVSLTAEDSLGKMLFDANPSQTEHKMTSVPLRMDIDKYSYLVVNTTNILKSANASIVLQDNESSSYYPFPKKIPLGVWVYNLKDSEWSGVKNFSIVVWLGDASGDEMWFDDMRITDVPPTPTPTPIITVNSIRPSVNLFLPKRGPMRVAYSLENSNRVKITIYNTSGRIIRTLVDEALNGPVISEAEWDGRNNSGDTVASGVYIIRIESNNYSKNIRVAVVK